MALKVGGWLRPHVCCVAVVWERPWADGGRTIVGRRRRLQGEDLADGIIVFQKESRKGW